MNYYILYRNINNFLHFFAWNHGTRIWFLCETQKYVEIFDNIWIITFYAEIFAIFGNFWPNFCLIYFSHWLSGRIFVWNHGRQIFSYRITQKIVPLLQYDENFCRKLPKIAKFGKIECLTLKDPSISECCIETKNWVKFLFSHFFVVPQKVLWRPLRP